MTANSIAQLLRELEWSGRASGYAESFAACPVCKGVKPGQPHAHVYFMDGAIGHKEGCRLESAAASLEAQEPDVYWVLYDATADKKYIKKSLGDGSLAFFDTEAEAKRAQRRHGHGVGCKRIRLGPGPCVSRPPTKGDRHGKHEGQTGEG